MRLPCVAVTINTHLSFEPDDTKDSAARPQAIAHDCALQVLLRTQPISIVPVREDDGHML